MNLDGFGLAVPAVRPGLAGDAQGGGSPLVGGAGSIAACQRCLLARSVPPAWGERAPPRLAPGGNGKGGLDSVLPQAISVAALRRSRSARNRSLNAVMAIGSGRPGSVRPIAAENGSSPVSSAGSCPTWRSHSAMPDTTASALLPRSETIPAS